LLALIVIPPHKFAKLPCGVLVTQTITKIVCLSVTCPELKQRSELIS